MSIAITPIVLAFSYNGIMLPDVPGLTPREVRDLYSAQYPELVSAEIEGGDVANGRQDYTFRKAVGTKGGDDPGTASRLAGLNARIEAEAWGDVGSDTRLSRAAERPAARATSAPWLHFATPDDAGRSGDVGARQRVAAPSELLAPLP